MVAANGSSGCDYRESGGSNWSFFEVDGGGGDMATMVVMVARFVTDGGACLVLLSLILAPTSKTIRHLG